MERITIIILSIATLVLLGGWGLLKWSMASKVERHFQTINVFSWLLIALFPVLTLFSLFPESSEISGTILGFSVTGAVALFVFIWSYGHRVSQKARSSDQQKQIDGLKSQLQQMKEEASKAPPKASRSPLSYAKYEYRLVRAPKKRIGCITGDILGVKSVDCWVNSENTYMQMSRYFESSISGVIRYSGALRDKWGYVTDDIIANELAHAVGDERHVQPGTVFETSAGELAIKNNVKKLLHVAAVTGEVGRGYHPVDNLEMCITNVLCRVDELTKKGEDLKSVLIPLLGTGHGRGDLFKIVGSLIGAAISFFELNPTTAVERIYFLAYTTRELDAGKSIMEQSARIKVST